MNWVRKLKRFLNPPSPKPRMRKEKASPVSRIYDLQSIYQEINIEYFEGKLQLSIDWFGREKTSRKISRKVLGYYDDRRKSIKIHRSLDSPSFPHFFLSYVVYHEMLHSVEPPIVGRKRRRVHHEGFRDKEKQFHSYAMAKQWEKEHLAKILHG